MKKSNVLFKLFFVICLSLVLGNVKTIAAEDGIGFSVRPIYSDTQIDAEKGYYYVQTEPGKKQELELSILSTTDDRDITVEFIVENAMSSTYGDIAYSNDPENIAKVLKHPITEIVKPRTEKVVIKPRQEEIMIFDLTPPKEHYEGVKMGRIVIAESSDDKKTGVGESYQYALGVITSEEGLAYNDGNKLDLEEVRANVVSGTKVVEGFILNPDPKTIENLEVRSYVTEKGKAQKLKENNIDNFTFAPSSLLKFEIPWGLTDFKGGEYTFHFEAKNQYESFNLIKDFTIKKEDANRLNKEAAFSVETKTIVKIIIIALNVVLVSLIITILMRDRKWIDELKNRKRRKNKKNGSRGKGKKGIN
ncbi:DUF3324 domain-containing protein [Vagococcus sp. DIV0080]|uniref:DUF3324 domain-containing protein n=1 Tax=Candidatus Vagococcus giribetii TaxID=2230876 RepID=A0ABS3HTB9_9ENTE|nr:DUF3324 domain-containing protein [Vagococcus sp. DIV0080]MBO0476477.1 DUF3324 domain-containing protein [Vagococcus sp. DIV0080]